MESVSRVPGSAAPLLILTSSIGEAVFFFFFFCFGHADGEKEMEVEAFKCLSASELLQTNRLDQRIEPKQLGKERD